MSDAGWVVAALTAAAMVADWWAVARHRPAIERLAKPAAMVGLLGVALLAGAPDSDAGRWLLLALAFGLLGDVMLLSDSPGRFVAGLAAFLLGHLAYVASFLSVGLDEPWLGVLGGAVLLVALLVGRGILPGALALGGPGLAAAVAAYMSVMGAMLVLGWATGRLLVGLGTSLFVVSDTVLAIGRFVRAGGWTLPTVMVTYHLAQVLIVIGVLAS